MNTELVIEPWIGRANSPGLGNRGGWKDLKTNQPESSTPFSCTESSTTIWTSHPEDALRRDAKATSPLEASTQPQYQRLKVKRRMKQTAIWPTTFGPEDMNDIQPPTPILDFLVLSQHWVLSVLLTWKVDSDFPPWGYDCLFFTGLWLVQLSIYHVYYLTHSTKTYSSESPGFQTWSLYSTVQHPSSN
jgi:hypothetical protein